MYLKVINFCNGCISSEFYMASSYQNSSIVNSCDLCTPEAIYFRWGLVVGFSYFRYNIKFWIAMNRELTQSFRGRTYSEGSHYKKNKQWLHYWKNVRIVPSSTLVTFAHRKQSIFVEDWSSASSDRQSLSFSSEVVKTSILSEIHETPSWGNVCRSYSNNFERRGSEQWR
jgi:hypothetical protein